LAVRLQWSRRANATETAGGVVTPGPRRDASMEPSRERDGDLSGCRGGSRRTGRFNGAVARTRRRRASAIAANPRSRCFNGAVARTRRRHEKVADENTRFDWLQWSRRANATETRGSQRHLLALRGMLQWSRRAN